MRGKRTLRIKSQGENTSNSIISLMAIVIGCRFKNTLGFGGSGVVPLGEKQRI